MESIRLRVTHSVSGLEAPELRFARGESVSAMKAALERRFGTSASAMRLVLRTADGQPVCTLADEACLSDYAVVEGMELHVIDDDPNSLTRQLNAASGPKFTLSDEEYARLPGSVRRFKERLRQERPELFVAPPAPPSLAVGERCEATLGEETRLRGWLRFVGQVSALGAGAFAGVELDEPLGDCDGRGLFKCGAKRGLFVPAEQVATGDFPELELDEI